MSIVSVVIDSREPESIKRLTFGCGAAICSLLDAGDLLAVCDDGTMIAIERKTPDDLLNSIRDNRIWAQLAGIRQVTKWAYLLITGELHRAVDGHVCTDGRSTGWTWASLQGALLQAQEMGVFVTYAANDGDYEAAVLRLAVRSHRDNILVSPARAPRVLNEAEQIICSLPGIGPEKVIPILDYAGTPAWALSWLTMLESQERVPGIGNGTKRTIRKALGLADDEELSVFNQSANLKEGSWKTT